MASEWSRATRIGTPLSLLLIDIDFFKTFNDEYGHPAGDRCLRRVAQVIQDAARRPQDLACRFGGEEFAVILPHTPVDGAVHVATAVREQLAAAAIPHRGSCVADHVTVSIGVACLDRGASAGGDRVRELSEARGGELRLIDLADRALYSAKRGGRNRTELAPEAP